MSGKTSLLRTLATAVAIATLLAACGGGDGATSATSDDGVVTLHIPSGAAPDGFQAVVTSVDPSFLGDLSEETGTFLAYEFGPDGTEFSEPVEVVFRISPEQGGFTPEDGLPLTLVVVEDGEGGFEPLGSSVSYLDGDTLVVEGTMTHFSKGVLHAGQGTITLGLDPEGTTKEVEQPFTVTVVDHARIQYGAVDKVEFIFSGDLTGTERGIGQADAHCTKEGSGTVEALVYGTRHLDQSDRIVLEAARSILLGAATDYLGRLTQTVTCVAAGETPPSTEASEIPSAISDGQVAVTADPVGDFLTLAELSTFKNLEQDPPAGMDITKVTVVYSRETNQTEITVDFAGSFQELDADEGRYLTLRPIFRNADGYLFEVAYSDGSAYLSSAPDGTTLAWDWLSPSRIRFLVTGYVPSPGESVDINVHSEVGSGSEKVAQGDRVSVAITE